MLVDKSNGFSIHKLLPSEWEKYSEEAHKIVFNETFPKHMNRIDFALLAVDENEMPCTYVTCRELDNETLYWQYGGSFPGTKGVGTKSWEIFCAFQSYIFKNYKRLTFLVENNNVPMLKFAMKADFRITGIRNYKNIILLEHFKEV